MFFLIYETEKEILREREKKRKNIKRDAETFKLTDRQIIDKQRYR